MEATIEMRTLEGSQTVSLWSPGRRAGVCRRLLGCAQQSTIVSMVATSAVHVHPEVALGLLQPVLLRSVCKHVCTQSQA